jgi:transcriptional regulator with XRE-family HTH domain
MDSTTLGPSTSPYAEFGRTLTAARVAAGIDHQADLAARLKCSQQSVSRWEAGVTRPRAAQVAALAAVLDLEPSGLLQLAGYGAQVGAAHYAQLFPVDRLDPETFERFVEYLLTLLYPAAHVQRAGSSGHKQDGLDITVVWPTRRHSFQCKRVERFGPAEVLRAVAAHSAPADKKHLVLSRIASPQAVEALRSFSDWEVWDKEKLTALIRLKLSEDDQNRLVDIFFRGQRLALLGRAEVGPWMTLDEFFAPWERRDAVFSHEWSLKGRDKEIADLTEALTRSNTPVVMLTGPGGMGKSRVIKEAMAASKETLPGVVVRFLATTSGEVDRRALDALGSRQKLLVVDDAHDRDGLGVLFEYVADPLHRAKLLLAMRPYAEARIKSEAAIYGIGGIPQILLDRLTADHTTDLVKEVLIRFDGDANWADEIVRVTRDCPLVAIMAARIFARDRIPIELVKSDEQLRRLILGKFMRVVAGDIGSAGDQRLIPGTLEVLALVQPFHIEDPQLSTLLGATKGMDPTDVARVLRLLLDGGIIYRRGYQYRLMPDLLGDYIIESSCIGPADQLLPFAERVFDSVAGAQLAHVLVNLGRLDWRRSGGDTSKSRLLGNLWRKLDDVDSDSDPRFEAVQAVAIYQPKQALDFIQHQFDDGRVPDGTGGIVRNVAYNYNYIEEACELLWTLGCNDKRELGPHPSHPIRVLSEMCGFEENKPLAFIEPVFDFGMRLIDREGAWDHRYSPLDILRPVLSGEGVNATSKGGHLQMSSFFVNLDVVAHLRRRLTDRVLTLLANDQPKIGRAAADFLSGALRFPMGLMGASVGPDVYNQYALEFEGTLSKLRTIIAGGDIHVGVMIGVARSIAWHAQNGPEKTAFAAQAVLDALPTDLSFRTRAALADGYGQVFLGKRRLDRWQEDLDAWIASLVAELKVAFPVGEKLRRHLELALADLVAVKDNENATHVLIGPLLRGDLELARAFVADAELRSNSLTRRFAGAALNEILCLSPAEGRAKVRSFFGSLDSDLEYAAAIALGSLRREVEAEDIDLLRTALNSADVAIAGAAVRSLWQWRGVDGRILIELVKVVRIEESVWLADEVAMIFTGLGEHILKTLSQDDVKHFLRRLLKVPKLDGHWLEQLLVHISLHYPHELADFFFKRVELAAGTKTFGEFRPANHGPYANARLKIDESPEAAAVLQKTWAWLRENEHRDVYFQYPAADVFNAMFMSVDDAMVALFEAKLESASKAELALMSRLLRNARPDFIFLHRRFTVRLLERCRDAGKDRLQEAIGALFGSAISGVRGGSLGEPASQDVKMVADAKEALKHVSRLSPAYRLYDGVRQFGDRNIAQTFRDMEALDEQ